MKIKKAIIAAPFGSYIKLDNATSTRGTYTDKRRLGAIWGALSRIEFAQDGIINRMGLRNPGIKSQNFEKHKDVIWSIGGFNYSSWYRALYLVPKTATVELNMSCPNIDAGLSGTLLKAMLSTAFLRFNGNVIVKLPADLDEGIKLFEMALSAGITRFHACNTIKTAKGGLSGRAIQDTSIPLIRHIKRECWALDVIAGGGIYTPDDVKRYRDVGADHYSLATIFFTPWKVQAVLNEIYK